MIKFVQLPKMINRMLIPGKFHGLILCRVSEWPALTVTVGQDITHTGGVRLTSSFI